MMRFELNLQCENERESVNYYRLVFGSLSVKFYHSHSIHLQREKKEKIQRKKKSKSKNKIKKDTKKTLTQIKTKKKEILNE